VILGHRGGSIIPACVVGFDWLTGDMCCAGMNDYLAVESFCVYSSPLELKNFIFSSVYDLDMGSTIPSFRQDTVGPTCDNAQADCSADCTGSAALSRASTCGQIQVALGPKGSNILPSPLSYIAAGCESPRLFLAGPFPRTTMTTVRPAEDHS